MEKAAPGSLLRSCDGYEIKRRFEGALGNVWSVSCGQPYPRRRFLYFSKLAPDKALEHLKVQQKRTVLQKESFQKTLVSLRKGIIHLEAEDKWLEEDINNVRGSMDAAEPGG